MDFRNIKYWTIPEGDAEIVTDANDNIIWEMPNRDYSREYFFVENISNETANVSFKKQMAAAPSIEVFYSTNRRNWTSLGTTTTTGISTTLAPGKRIYLKATTNAWGTSLVNYNTIRVNKRFKVGGNILSLTKGDSYKSYTTISYNYIFTGLLGGNSNLTSAADLKLPRNTTEYCYDQMFYGCTNLTEVPELPATTKSKGCYQEMFRGCTSLTTAPELPGGTADSCYKGMFYGCRALTAAPALPSGTVLFSCYEEMFRGCTALTTAPALSADNIGKGAYAGMFRGCTALTSAPALPAVHVGSAGYEYMFRGCTSLTTAPALPATYISDYSYWGMFYECTALTSAPALPAVSLKEGCYKEMFRGCTSLTSAPVLPATTLAQNCYDSMFWGCSNLNNVTTYANDISASNCILTWLNSVSSTGNFFNLGNPAPTYPSGDSGIPTGWVEHRSL